MSHSKRNTSLAFFTSHERSLLRSTWGSQSQRLTRDSFLQFGSCTLCLMPCQDPVVCAGGPAPVSSATNGSASSAPPTESRKRKRGDGKQECHMFCRECIMANLLAQRKELKRLERLSEAEKAEALDLDAREDEEARVRAIEEFERVQQGLEVHSHSRESRRARVGPEEDASTVPVARRIGDGAVREVDDGKQDAEDKAPGEGRGFELDEEELLRIAREDRQKARQALSDEKAASSKSSLPSFWVPSLTPAGQKSSVAKSPTAKKPQPICPGSTPATTHPLSLKTLVSVLFSEDGDARQGGSSTSVNSPADPSNAATKVCPACSRQLTNASNATLAKPCGHVVCGSCVSRFIVGDEGDVVSSSEFGKAKELRCFVCNEALTERKKPKGADEMDTGKEKDKDKVKPGLVEICSEGTGFAGGGKNVVKAEGTAFQC